MDISPALEFIFGNLAYGFRRPGRALALIAFLLAAGGSCALAFHLLHGFDWDVPSAVLILALTLAGFVVATLAAGVLVRAVLHLAGAVVGLLFARG